MKTVWPIAVSIALIALCAAGIKHEAFQAIAHLWVGGLLGAWLAAAGREFLWLAVGLSIAEVVCFFLV